MTDDKPTRRDFLRGKRVEEPTSEESIRKSDTESDSPNSVDLTGEPYLLKFGRRAMACQFQVMVNVGKYEAATEIAIEALDRVDELEQMFTVYRDDSEVSQLNQLAAGDYNFVSPELADLLRMSLQLHEMTSGAFEITAGPIADVWDKARRDGVLPSETEIERALQQVGSQHIAFDEKEDTISFLKAGVALNFGGIGKGYALDDSASILESRGMSDFLFHGGRSSVLARGQCASAAAGESPWRVGVIHPLRPNQRLAEVRLENRALSTSGSQTQSVTFGGRRYGHIIDPRTGWPAEGVLSVTVVAQTGAEADAMSTALYVLGVERGLELCEQHPQFGAIFVTPGDRVGEIRISSCNLGEQDFHVLSE
jgi:thiamine biosynthesis lipoprotein